MVFSCCKGHSEDSRCRGHGEDSFCEGYGKVLFVKTTAQAFLQSVCQRDRRVWLVTFSNVLVFNMGVTLVDLPSQHRYRTLMRRTTIEKNNHMLAAANSESITWKLCAAEVEIRLRQCSSWWASHTDMNSESGMQNAVDALHAAP